MYLSEVILTFAKQTFAEQTFAEQTFAKQTFAEQTFAAANFLFLFFFGLLAPPCNDNHRKPVALKAFFPGFFQNSTEIRDYFSTLDDLVCTIFN